MTEPINLVALREQYADPGDDLGAREDARRVLALIDAVEAANDWVADGIGVLDRHMSPEVELRTRQGLIEAAQRLDQALARFDFEPPT